MYLISPIVDNGDLHTCNKILQLFKVYEECIKYYFLYI